ncbi:hypothetical protein PMZ80_001966 [Knufia obscura]|uniref:Pyridoxamine 5'-phosphate oxidase Alr4036 family FMN-binding domain-containing protein n=2 Tax=Knufia TaxID=430999 RepID=A0AAN8EEI5_9EURO|nr:hypothetical protein PMZ80_001966 [Knufia obscura]KAK5953784.1 hypothetical protein OHC33_005053 [Knufia fluminis]
MSAHHPTVVSEAPWKADFESHLEKIGGPSAEFYLATVTPEGAPRVRTCIHRGFWAQLPENKHNELPKNPAIYQSDCPVFTNDARMEKTYHIFATGKGKGDREQSKSGTGGGGPVEAVYWVKDTMTQWRVRGKAWLVAADDVEGGTDEAQNSGTVTVKAQVGRYMRPVGDHATKNSEWSWKNEVENHFENLSPGMRGTFRNPPPGHPLSEGKGEGEELGQKVGHLADDELARKNFRVVIITPEEVERVDLSDPEKSKRWIYTLSQESGGQGGGDESKPSQEWDVTETWP